MLEPGGSLESLVRQALIEELRSSPPRALDQIKMEILFTEEQLLLHWRDSRSGEERTIGASVEALRCALNLQPQDSGYIPSNVCRWGKDERGSWGILFVPPSHRLTLSVSLDDTEAGVVQVRPALPAFVFAGVGSTYFIWAVRGRAFSPAAAAFHAPVPNLDESGRICFGANHLPLATPETLGVAWEVFVASPFNSHTANGKSQRYPEDVRSMLLEVAGQGRRAYPVLDLVPCGCTVGQLLARHILRPRR